AASGDLADVRGQPHAKRALEVAAAGSHNLLLLGPPGSGKTMLARRLPSILPPLTLEEAIEVTAIHSVAGLLDGRPLIAARPVRSGPPIAPSPTRHCPAAGTPPGLASSHWPTAACSPSTSCRSSGETCSSRCASRSRSAVSPSRAAAALWSSPPTSS